MLMITIRLLRHCTITNMSSAAPAIKVDFEKYITSHKISQLARNLKDFLKSVNVDQKALNDVTLAFLEEGQSNDKLGSEYNPIGRKMCKLTKTEYLEELADKFCSVTKTTYFLVFKSSSPEILFTS